MTRILEKANIKSIFPWKNDVLFQSKTNTQSQLIQARVEDEISIVNYYLWVHGIGFTLKLSWKWENIKNFLISLILSLFFDLGAFVYIFLLNYKIKIGENKNLMAFSAAMIMNVILKIFICIKRRKLNFILHQLARLYANTTREFALRFKRKVSAVLFFHDAFIISAAFFFNFYVFPENPVYKDGTRYAEVVAICVCCFVVEWSTQCPAIPLFFCTASYLLRNIIFELKERVSKSTNLEAEPFYEAYNEIIHFIELINEEFHITLATDIAILLGLVFREMFMVLFETHDSAFTIIHLILMTVEFSRFVMICHFASTVSQAISKLKLSILQKPLDLSQLETFKLIFYFREDFGAFQILGSVPLNNGLILAVAGSLLSYGILIATFNRSGEDN